MSARKAVNGTLKQVTLVAGESRLALSPDGMVIHKGGIEFRSEKPFNPWTELTLTLHARFSHGRLHCNGVVISCTGNRHTGYHVSMVFTGLSKQGEALMSQMAAMV
jgi:hypothetical protein